MKLSASMQCSCTVSGLSACYLDASRQVIKCPDCLYKRQFSGRLMCKISFFPNSGGRELAGLGIEYTPDGRTGPQLGAQFAQLVKELRSEYAGAITGCAQRIASVSFSMGPRILTRLQQHGLTGNPAQTAQEVLEFSSGPINLRPIQRPVNCTMAVRPWFWSISKAHIDA